MSRMCVDIVGLAAAAGGALHWPQDVANPIGVFVVQPLGRSERPR